MYNSYGQPQQPPPSYGINAWPTSVSYGNAWTRFENLMKTVNLGYETLTPQQQHKIYLLWNKYLEEIRVSPYSNDQQLVLNNFYGYAQIHRDYLQEPPQQQQSFATLFTQQPTQLQYVSQYPTSPMQYGQPQRIINNNNNGQLFTAQPQQQPQAYGQQRQLPPPLPPSNFQQLQQTLQQSSPITFLSTGSQSPLIQQQQQQQQQQQTSQQRNPPIDLDSAKRDEKWKAATKELSISFTSKLGKLNVDQVKEIISLAISTNHVTLDKASLYSAKYSGSMNNPYVVIALYVIPSGFDAPTLGWKHVKKEKKNTYIHTYTHTYFYIHFCYYFLKCFTHQNSL